MSQKLGNEEIKDVISLVVKSVESISVISEDGKIGVSDIPAIWVVVEKLGKAMVGSQKIPQEFDDLSETEVDELIDYVMVEYSKSKVPAKIIVEKSVKAVKALFDVYKEVKK
jgi:hypothetical protein